jgi:hypothetical protein
MVTYAYSAPDKPAIDQLYSVQLADDKMNFGEPTFHLLRFNKGGDFGQFLANVTGLKVRMTKCERMTDNITSNKGIYFAFSKAYSTLYIQVFVFRTDEYFLV